MEIRAFLKGVASATVHGSPQSFAVFAFVSSVVFVVTITLFLWWGALTGIEQNLPALLRLQMVGVAVVLFAFMLSDTEEWRKISPHKRFAFLAFSCAVSPMFFISMLEFTPHVMFFAAAVAWSGVVFFYTRFFFTYRVFCDVRD